MVALVAGKFHALATAGVVVAAVAVFAGVAAMVNGVGVAPTGGLFGTTGAVAAVVVVVGVATFAADCVDVDGVTPTGVPVFAATPDDATIRGEPLAAAGMVTGTVARTG